MDKVRSLLAELNGMHLQSQNLQTHDTIHRQGVMNKAKETVDEFQYFGVVLHRYEI